MRIAETRGRRSRGAWTLVPCLLGVTVAWGVSVSTPGAPGIHGRSPVQRPVRPRLDDGPGRENARGDIPYFPFDERAVTGFGNNVRHPEWGSAGITVLRLATSDYGDGVGTPSGADRASARIISNVVIDQTAPKPNPACASDYLWMWGQFIDHDIVETPVTDPGEAFDIVVPTGDPWFDPDGHGGVMIPFDRSAWTLDGVRQQMNGITAYLDGSMVYGSDEARANWLRRLDGTGNLVTSAGDLLPFNTEGFDNAPDSGDPSYFLAGDIRANEHLGLLAMHTLFMREHNYWAKQHHEWNEAFTESELWKHARGFVAAEIQAITYREFLPILLGPDPLPPYAGPNLELDPGISNEFAAAAFRFGHTMLSPQLLRLDADGDPIPAGNIPLVNSFFNPQEIIDHGIDPLLRGLARQCAEDVDVYMIGDVRNMLFNAPIDLAALNIQRGRDHGLPGYNQLRVDFGLAPVTTFAEMTDDGPTRKNLAKVYATVDDVDAWVGMLAEPPADGGMVGETLQAVLREQFIRLRDGDPFWYESYLPLPLRNLINQQTLATVIRRNTSIAEELQDNPFYVNGPPCLGDLNGDRVIDLADLLAILGAWGPCDGCPEDLTDDDVVDMTDLLVVLGAWGVCDS